MKTASLWQVAAELQEERSEVLEGDHLDLVLLGAGFDRFSRLAAEAPVDTTLL